MIVNKYDKYTGGGYTVSDIDLFALHKFNQAVKGYISGEQYEENEKCLERKCLYRKNKRETWTKV